MNSEKCNIEVELPEPLTREELLFYFQEMAKGNKSARDKIIRHNLRLVYYEIWRKFRRVKVDKNELLSIGTIGLIKSIDRFDISKNSEFSTYAVYFIDGEITSFLREQQKIPNVISIESSISSNKDNNDLRIADILRDDFNFILEYEQKEIYRIINNIIEKLPSRDREIIKHYFGFYDNIPKSQVEIANITGLSQAQVSRVLNKIINQIKLELYEQKVLEYSDLTIKKRYKEREKVKPPKKTNTIYTLFNYYSKSQVDDMLSRITEDERELVAIRYGEDLEHPVATEKWNKENKRKFITLYGKMRYLLANPEKMSNPFKKGNKEKMAKKLHCIYEYFKNYSREQVDEMLTKLTEEERKLITLRYGEDLDNPSTSEEWTSEYQYKFYGSLVPKMKRLLANSIEETKQGKKEQKKDNIKQSVVKKTPVILDSSSSLSIKEDQVEWKKITKPSELQESLLEQVQTSNDCREMTKEDYIKILELLRTPTFTQMMSTLSVKESVILSLKLGYIGGKYFSTESIAQFLGIEEREVVETTKKVLLIYKDCINAFLDNAIEVATDKADQKKF